jgi:RNA polymerase sigma-54 factor
MALQLRQELRLTQQLIMTPQLQMAIKLLQLNRIELVDRIHQELEENPALLKDENIKLARRTVAKYREQLGILSSAKRRQF